MFTRLHDSVIGRNGLRRISGVVILEMGDCRRTRSCGSLLSCFGQSWGDSKAIKFQRGEGGLIRAAHTK